MVKKEEKVKKFLLTVAASVLLLLSGCGKEEPQVPEKKVFYTQVNMWYVDKKYSASDPNQLMSVSTKREEPMKADHLIEATNFKRDHLIPLNSPVEIVHSSKDAIFFIYQDKMIALQNIKKYTRIDTADLLKRTFREEKVDLSMYSSERRAEIEQGDVVEGMSKAAVLLARGYPPAHKTPDMNADDWRYWNGRANSRMYHFKDGKYTGFTD